MRSGGFQIRKCNAVTTKDTGHKGKTLAPQGRRNPRRVRLTSDRTYVRLSSPAAGSAMTPEFRRDDQWWVSPFNVANDVRRSFALPARVQIHDATLRDG